MKELSPSEKAQIKGIGEQLPSQAFAKPKVETAVDRINKEIDGWLAIVVKATIRIEYLEKQRESFES